MLTFSSGIAVVVVGQTLRSVAMITAAANFNHAVQFKKQDEHKLVTNGIYAYVYAPKLLLPYTAIYHNYRIFRHPSYAGFFYWALGSQLVLQNPVSFVAFVVVLWRFFYHRTRSMFAVLLAHSFEC